MDVAGSSGQGVRARPRRRPRRRRTCTHGRLSHAGPFGVGVCAGAGEPADAGVGGLLRGQASIKPVGWKSAAPSTILSASQGSDVRSHHSSGAVET